MGNPRLEDAIGTVNGVNTNFTTVDDFEAGTLNVWIDGQLHRSSDDDGWTETGSNSFTLKEAPLTGTRVRVFYLDTFPVVGADVERITGVLQATDELTGTIVSTDSLLGTLIETDDIIGVLRNLSTLKGTIVEIDTLVGILTEAGGDVAVKEYPFEDVAEVTVPHNLGRLPVVQVLVVPPGGSYGGGGFGGGGFGTQPELEDLSEDFFELIHLDDNNFKIVFTNFYTGVILYI